MTEQTEPVDAATCEAVRNHFLGWQCRIRQIAMRQDGGRPSSGMRPRLLLASGQELSPGLVVVIVPQDPEESTEFFQFQLRKTHDPNLVYERGLQYLSATHFQNAKKFSDQLTALFGAGSSISAALLDAGECILEFSQFSQTYRILCAVRELPPGDSAHEATVWHNKIFNPNLPAAVQVVAFQPDWRSAQADPMPS